MPISDSVKTDVSMCLFVVYTCVLLTLFVTFPELLFLYVLFLPLLSLSLFSYVLAKHVDIDPNSQNDLLFHPSMPPPLDCYSYTTHRPVDHG